MSVEAQEADEALDVNLVFTKTDLRDVVPHNNDPVVISVVTVGRKVLNQVVFNVLKNLNPLKDDEASALLDTVVLVLALF